MRKHLPFIYLAAAAAIAGVAYANDATFVPYMVSILLVLLALECSDRM